MHLWRRKFKGLTTILLRQKNCVKLSCTVLRNLSQDLLKLPTWFHENCMILNPEKCHYMNLGKDFEGDLLRLCGEVLGASQIETVLGIQIDNKLNFEKHVKYL